MAVLKILERWEAADFALVDDEPAPARKTRERPSMSVREEEEEPGSID